MANFLLLSCRYSTEHKRTTHQPHITFAPKFDFVAMTSRTCADVIQPCLFKFSLCASSVVWTQSKWQIVVKLNIPLFRYFYNHLSNYTKTIIRLRLVNIGEYSPRLRLGEYLTIIRRRRSEYYLTIKTCDKTFLNNIVRFKKVKSDKKL